MTIRCIPSTRNDFIGRADFIIEPASCQVSTDVKDLKHINSFLEAESGGRGTGKDCIGKNAKHTVVKVPVGTIVRNTAGDVLADLDEAGMMFIAARGGAGGHGNAFFASDVQQSPRICEYGAQGEECEYVLEIRSMAHLGLVIKHADTFFIALTKSA